MSKPATRLFASACVLLASGFLLATPRGAVADEKQPVLVVSIAGYDKVVENAGVIGEMIGMPLGQMIDGQVASLTQNQGLQGLDKSKPWVVAAYPVDGEFQGFVCLPVTDLTQLLGSLPPPLAETQDAGDGVLQLSTPQPAFVKAENGWAYVAPQKEHLDTLPADPAALAGDLPKEYLIAVRAMIQNVPEANRQQVLGMFDMLSGQLAESGDPDAQLQQKMMQRQKQQMQQLAADVDELTVGLGIEPADKKLFLDFIVTAVPDSKTAQQWARVKSGASKFSGFLSDDAAFSMLARMDGQRTDDELEIIQLQHDEAKKRALGHIDSDAGIPTEAKQAVKDAVGQLIDVGFDTMKSDTFDLGMAVFANQQSTLVAGGLVADAAALEEAIKNLAGLMEAELPAIQWDAATHEGYRFHTVSIPTPDPQAAQFVGPNVELALAFGEDRCYLAVGGAAIEQTKAIIDASAADPTAEVPPMQMTLRLAPLLNAAAAVDETGMAAQMAEAVKEQGSIKVSTTSIPNGAKSRIEVEQNVIKALGSLVPMWMTLAEPAAIGGPPAAADPF